VCLVFLGRFGALCIVVDNPDSRLMSLVQQTGEFGIEAALYAAKANAFQDFGNCGLAHRTV